MFMPGMLELLDWVPDWAGCVWLQATLDKNKAVTKTVIRFGISERFGISQVLHGLLILTLSQVSCFGKRPEVTPDYCGNKLRT